MARICEICKKGSVFGRSITRKGLAKKKGGVGQHITGSNLKKFKPNLQRVKAIIAGTVRYYNICTRCLKSGKVTKA